MRYPLLADNQVAAAAAAAPRRKRALRVPSDARPTSRLEPLRSHERRVIYAPGEPLRVEGEAIDRAGRPRSLWTALYLWRKRDPQGWAALLGWYGMRRGESLCLESVLWCAQRTDRVLVWRHAGRIVRWVVWIDSAGEHTLEVTA